MNVSTSHEHDEQKCGPNCSASSSASKNGVNFGKKTFSDLNSAVKFIVKDKESGGCPCCHNIVYFLSKNVTDIKNEKDAEDKKKDLLYFIKKSDIPPKTTDCGIEKRKKYEENEKQIIQEIINDINEFKNVDGEEWQKFIDIAKKITQIDCQLDGMEELLQLFIAKGKVIFFEKEVDQSLENLVNSLTEKIRDKLKKNIDIDVQTDPVTNAHKDVQTDSVTNAHKDVQTDSVTNAHKDVQTDPAVDLGFNTKPLFDALYLVENLEIKEEILNNLKEKYGIKNDQWVIDNKLSLNFYEDFLRSINVPEKQFLKFLLLYLKEKDIIKDSDLVDDENINPGYIFNLINRSVDVTAMLKIAKEKSGKDGLFDDIEKKLCTTDSDGQKFVSNVNFSNFAERVMNLMPDRLSLAEDIIEEEKRKISSDELLKKENKDYIIEKITEYESILKNNKPISQEKVNEVLKDVFDVVKKTIFLDDHFAFPPAKKNDERILLPKEIAGEYKDVYYLNEDEFEILELKVQNAKLKDLLKDNENGIESLRDDLDKAKTPVDLKKIKDDAVETFDALDKLKGEGDFTEIVTDGTKYENITNEAKQLMNTKDFENSEKSAIEKLIKLIKELVGLLKVPKLLIFPKKKTQVPPRSKITKIPGYDSGRDYKLNCIKKNTGRSRQYSAQLSSGQKIEKLKNEQSITKNDLIDIFSPLCRMPKISEEAIIDNPLESIPIRSILQLNPEGVRIIVDKIKSILENKDDNEHKMKKIQNIVISATHERALTIIKALPKATKEQMIDTIERDTKDFLDRIETINIKNPNYKDLVNNDAKKTLLSWFSGDLLNESLKKRSVQELNGKLQNLFSGKENKDVIKNFSQTTLQNIKLKNGDLVEKWNKANKQDNECKRLGSGRFSTVLTKEDKALANVIRVAAQSADDQRSQEKLKFDFDKAVTNYKESYKESKSPQRPSAMSLY